MYNHAGPDYDCPFCRVVNGEDDRDFYTKQSDVFYRNEHVTAFITVGWWPNNPGHAVVVPNEHIENLYDMPFETGGHILAAARAVAIAFKQVYGCDGTSTRQHNEPKGAGQEVLHYHLHVFPRWENDYFYDLSCRRRVTTPEERAPYAEKLRAYFENLKA